MSPVRARTVAAVAAALAASAAARAQTTIASLAWTGATSGIRAQNYPPAQDSMDLWVVEDFQTSRPWLLGTFTCMGSGIGGATDVIAVVLDALPPGGTQVLRSTPGTGHVVSALGWGRYETSFSNQRLRPGSYWIMWQADGSPSTILPVMFVQGGAYSVGYGTPNNAYEFNPGGGWNLPAGVLQPITDGLNHTGNPIGINFTLSGTAAPCPADFDGNGAIEPADVAAFVNLWFNSLITNTICGDFDLNGTVAPADVAAFVGAWIAAAAAGC